MTEPTLSPAAQAVMDAYVNEDRAGRLAVAAALRALEVHAKGNPPDFSDPDEVMFSAGWDGCLRYIRSIADELESQ